MLAARKIVTSEEEAAETLLKAGALQSAIFNSANFSSIATDAQGVIQIFNVGAERMLGYAAAEVMNKITPADISDPQELIARAASLSMELATPITPGFEALVFKASRGIEDIYELTYIRKDGSRFPAVVSVTALRDAQDAIIGYLLIGTDNTARKLVEEERKKLDQRLRDQQFYTRSLIESNIDAIMTTDPAGIITDVNRQMEALTGCSRDELIGAPFKDFFTDPERAEAAINRALNEKSVTNYELTARARNGEQTVVLYNATTFYDRNRTLQGVFGAARDVTERKRTEEQLVQAQKMEMVGQLSGGIAHDFNNLLTVIVGNAEFLGEHLSTQPDLKQLADAIGNAGDRGAELTQQLLAFSRRQMLRPVAIDCNGLLTSMHKLLRRTLRADIEIRSEFDGDLCSAFADPAQLESAVLNLALNAQDAMVAGGCLTLTTANASLDDHYQTLNPGVLPGEYIQISVTDTGVGIGKDVIPHVFEPFFTTKEVGKGSGLGLSMVYGFIKQSDGHVSIYSEPGLGTTIRMYLPRTVTQLRRSAEDPRNDESDAPCGSETVMVVEDDPFVRSFVGKRLESLGYTVLAAVDGRDALRKLKAGNHIDILFTDIVMPGGIDGWELAEKAKQIQPGLPVLLTSGYALETLVQQGRIRAGAMVLSKPYRRDVLARRLREILLIGSLSSLVPESAVPSLSTPGSK
jgi:PAS domain S-box-containing protein